MMELSIAKIDDEFVIVELEDGIREVCPKAIFSGEIKIGDIFVITPISESYNNKY